MLEWKRLQTLRLKSLVWVTICGVLVSLVTGLVENPPEASIIGAKHYGYPLVWRITMVTINNYTEFRFTSLAIDIAFWITISFIASIILEKILLPKFGLSLFLSIGLPLVLFIPLGLVMDFVHEFGHALWGTAMGGRLAYMKIAYIEIFPRLALTSEFILGYTRVEGLGTEFANGLFLLGGSMTTNIFSWLLILILIRTKLGSKTQVALRILGLLGLLDLPFYVIFPQIGLQHWVFLGGDIPEPLIGARKMGIPDPAFYTITVLTTLGLLFLYFKPFWGKYWKKIKITISLKRGK